MMTNLSRKPRSAKPTKPRPDFPLTAHPNGQWSKKVRNQVFYFGVWDDPDSALAEWLRVKDDLLAGRTPRPRNGFTVTELCNCFLTAKKQLLDEGEITPKTFGEYARLTDRIMGHFSKHRLVEDIGPSDFQAFRGKLAAGVSASTLRKLVSLIESVFNFAFNNSHVEKPVRFGSEFRGPSRRTLRLERKRKPKRAFEAGEIRRLLSVSGGQLRAMILLGINCGFGNSDCATLPRETLDLDNGWMDFHRIKTGIDRRSPLWPETVAALRQAIEQRPAARSEADDGLVFLTKYGQRWVRDRMSRKTAGKHVSVDSIAQEMRKLMAQAKVVGGRNFYALRHTFETVGGDAKDQVAVNALMGHVDDSMAGVYRQWIMDERLRAVTLHVRRWLFPDVLITPQSGDTAKETATA